MLNPLHRLAPNVARLTVDLGVYSGRPPTEFRIFKKGSFKALRDQGRDEFFFTEASAKSVMAKAAKKGTDYAIDYEHQSVNTFGRAPAAGFFSLSVKDGELWATGVNWTAQGAADLSAGVGPQGQRTPPQYRYFSPVFTFDQKTGVIDELINIGLTNMPATRDMVPLAASYRPALALPPAARAGLPLRTAPTRSTPPPSRAALGSATEHYPMSDKKIAREATTHAFETLKSAHAHETSALRANVTTLQASNEELAAKLSEASNEKSALAASVQAAEEKVAALEAEAKAVAGIVEKATLAEAKGAFAALKAEAGKAKEYAEKFAKQETDAKQAKLSELIEKGIAEGKFLPAEKPMLLNQDLSFVEQSLALRPKIVNVLATQDQRPATAAANAIDPEIAKLAEQMGWDHAKVTATKIVQA